MASRYRRRQVQAGRSKTPDPESSMNQSWMESSPHQRRSRVPRRSVGGWGSMGSLDQIMNSLQESIQQKSKDYCGSFESLDNLSDEDDDSGIRMMDTKSKLTLKQKDDTPEPGLLLPRRRMGSRSSLAGSRTSLNGSQDNIADDGDYRMQHRSLPRTGPEPSIHTPPTHDTDDCSSLSGLNTSRSTWGSAQNIDSDIGLFGGLSRTKLNDNWSMKKSDTDSLKSSSWATPARLDLSDLNNNDEDEQYNPRFTKSVASFSRQHSSDRPRSRWDCSSPVSIKHEDSKTDTITKDGRLTSDGYSTLPLVKKSAHGRLPVGGTTDKSPQSPVRKPIAKPSPGSVVSNPKFRKGFNLNAQRQLSNDEKPMFRDVSPRIKLSESNLYAKSSHSSQKPSDSPRSKSGDSPRSRSSDSSRTKWEERQVDSSILSQLTMEAEETEGGAKGGAKGPYITITDTSMDNEGKANTSKASDGSPNRSYEAFFVSYVDPPENERPTQEEIAAMTEEERAVKFPQWVIPFIDDKLTGKFEYADRRAVAKGRSPTRKLPSPAQAIQRRSKSPATTPVAPPRTKRTAAMTRILQEKDDMACKERPLDKQDKSRTPIKVPERVKSPTRSRSPKRLPQVPMNNSEPESFPIHYVQHPKSPTVSATKGAKLRTAATQKTEPLKHSVNDTKLNQRSRTTSRVDLSKPEMSVSRPRASSNPRTNLTKNRAKSMDNLALLNSSRRENRSPQPWDRAANRDRSTGRERSLSRDNTNGRDRSVGRTRIKSDTSTKPEPGTITGVTENRAMRAMREARALQARPGTGTGTAKVADRGDRTSLNKEPLSQKSSVESVRNRSRSSSNQGQSGYSTPTSGRSTPVDKQDKSTVRTRARARFERQDSSESNSSTDRVRMRRAVSIGSSLNTAKTEDYSKDTFTLPRRKPNTDAASTHQGGYGTLRKQPKSILKKSATDPNFQAGPDITEPVEEIAVTSSGKRVLPKPPDNIIDSEIERALMTDTWISSSRENLSRSSSRDDLYSPTSRSRILSASSDASSVHSLTRKPQEESRTGAIRGKSSGPSATRSTVRSKSPGPNTTRAKSPGPNTTRAKSPGPNTTRAKSLGPNTTRAKSPGPNTTRAKSPSPGTVRSKSPGPSSKPALATKPSLSTSRENLLKRSSSQDSQRSTGSSTAGVTPPKPGNTASTAGRLRRTGLASSKENLLKSREDKTPPSPRTLPYSGSRSGHRISSTEPRSPTLIKTGLQPVDSIKKHKRLPSSPATSRNVSDRFRKLMEGDVTETPPPGNNERENSFDSGVEFIMHL